MIDFSPTEALGKVMRRIEKKIAEMASGKFYLTKNSIEKFDLSFVHSAPDAEIKAYRAEVAMKTPLLGTL